ncbi:hypothetical protein PFMC_05216 [Plasmodium falciparum CAMP/Malaysia]|uniref:Uncharacterized protein n=1 Tax=Plasmodium falciparum (isolate Camp / Malaysia) TaxID=5835 RepID=A0A024X2A3_PLAFC|nr:hypothetical protein PFMC_05216 [Plasmodium falciparum CAMP/Malaysia]
MYSLFEGKEIMYTPHFFMNKISTGKIFSKNEKDRNRLGNKNLKKKKCCKFLVLQYIFFLIQYLPERSGKIKKKNI